MEMFGFTLDIDKLVSGGITLFTNLVVAIAIFIIGKWIAKKIINVVTKMLERSKVDDTLINFLGNVLYGVLMLFIIMAALGKLGVNTTSFVAMLGAATLAIGMSLQAELANFAAGVLIVLFRPISKGDFVEINGEQGTVTDISWINTRFTTLNNHELIIPNSQITSSTTINYTSLPSRRVDVAVGIGYGADIKQARDVILKVATSHNGVFSDPAPIVNVTGLGDNSVDLLLMVWTSNKDWLQIQCDLFEAIKYALDDASIEIPFPQRSVHITGLEEAIDKLKS